MIHIKNHQLLLILIFDIVDNYLYNTEMKANSVKLLYNNLVTNSKESAYKIHTQDNISQVNFQDRQVTKICNDAFSNSNNVNNDLKSKFNQIITQVSPGIQQNNMPISNGDLLEEMQNEFHN